MVQVPAAIAVTVLPLMVQMPGVLLVKLAARPDVAVALTVPVPPTTTLGAAPKVMVWLVRAPVSESPTTSTGVDCSCVLVLSPIWP
jgi:hypothetical protein